jgi:hypothetical protein
MSAPSPAKDRRALLDRLTRERRDQLILVGRTARGLFGRARFQHVFDHNLDLFEFLAGQGATATMIGELLAAVGISREDGSPLPAGTVSSGLSRARRDRALRTMAVARPLAEPCMPLQAAAGPGKGMQRHAGNAAAPGPLVPPPAARLPRFRPPPNETAALPAATRRAAALLDQLRRNQNDDEDQK